MKYTCRWGPPSAAPDHKRELRPGKEGIHILQRVKKSPESPRAIKSMRVKKFENFNTSHQCHQGPTPKDNTIFKTIGLLAKKHVLVTYSGQKCPDDFEFISNDDGPSVTKTIYLWKWIKLLPAIKSKLGRPCKVFGAILDQHLILSPFGLALRTSPWEGATFKVEGDCPLPPVLQQYEKSPIQSLILSSFLPLLRFMKRRRWILQQKVPNYQRRKEVLCFLPSTLLPF